MPLKPLLIKENYILKKLPHMLKNTQQMPRNWLMIKEKQEKKVDSMYRTKQKLLLLSELEVSTA